jgi:hypothetical protein
MKAWDQLPDEGPIAYALFRAYLQSEERSLMALAIESGRSEDVVYKLVQKFRWVTRTRSYDRWVSETENAAMKREIQDAAVKWARRRAAFREIEYTVAQKAMALADRIMSWPLESQTIESEERTLEADGIHVHRTVIRVEPMRVTHAHAASLMKEGSNLARLSSGMETERKLLGVQLPDIERIEKARELYDRFLSLYEGQPEVLAELDAWIAGAFDVDQRLLLAAGDQIPIDVPVEVIADDSEN